MLRMPVDEHGHKAFAGRCEGPRVAGVRLEPLRSRLVATILWRQRARPLDHLASLDGTLAVDPECQRLPAEQGFARLQRGHVRFRARAEPPLEGDARILALCARADVA